MKCLYTNFIIIFIQTRLRMRTDDFEDIPTQKHTIFAINAQLFHPRPSSPFKTTSLSRRSNKINQTGQTFFRTSLNNNWVNLQSWVLKKNKPPAHYQYAPQGYRPQNYGKVKNNKNIIKNIEDGFPQMKKQSAVIDTSQLVARRSNKKNQINKIYFENKIPYSAPKKKTQKYEQNIQITLSKKKNKNNKPIQQNQPVRKVSILSLKPDKSLYQKNQKSSPGLNIRNSLKNIHKNPVNQNNIFLPITNKSPQKALDNSHYNNGKYENEKYKKKIHTQPQILYDYENKIKNLQQQLQKSKQLINQMKFKQLENQITKLKEKDKAYQLMIQELANERQEKKNKQIIYQNQYNKDKIRYRQQKIQKLDNQRKKASSSLQNPKKIDNSQKLNKKRPQSYHPDKNNQQSAKRVQTEPKFQQKSKKQNKQQAPNYHVIADHAKQIQTQKQFISLDPIKSRQKLLTCYNQLKNLPIPQININPFRIPKIPNPPKPTQSVQSFINSANQLCKCLNLQMQQNDIVIKKYKNCIHFKLVDPEKSVIWCFDGKVYAGGWIDGKQGEGKKQGKGIQITSNYCYQGQFHDNRKFGAGIAQYYNGNVYEGQWKSGKMDGKGIYFDKKNSIYYQGQWSNNDLKGRGIIKYTKKHYYTGQLKNFHKSGKGTQFFQNGDIYEGSFQKQFPNGYGIHYANTKQYYVGNFKNGKRHGTGLELTNKFEDIQKSQKIQQYFYGQFFEGKRSGYGILRNIDSSYYLGYFYKDLPHGPGILQNNIQNGKNDKEIIKMTGMWKNGKMVVKNTRKQSTQKSKNQSQQISMAN